MLTRRHNNCLPPLIWYFLLNPCTVISKRTIPLIHSHHISMLRLFSLCLQLYHTRMATAFFTPYISISEPTIFHTLPHPYSKLPSQLSLHSPKIKNTCPSILLLSSFLQELHPSSFHPRTHLYLPSPYSPLNFLALFTSFQSILTDLFAVYQTSFSLILPPLTSSLAFLFQDLHPFLLSKLPQPNNLL